MITNSLPAPVLQQLVAALGGLAREIAAGQAPDDDDLALLLLGVGLEEDAAALAELQRWTKLLLSLRGKPGSRSFISEALVLRGVPEASALLAVETVCAAAASPAGAAAAPVPLQVEPNELDFGTCRDGQPLSAELQVRGGPGTIRVESAWVKVEPQAFGPGQTTVWVTVTPPADGLLLTPLTFSTTVAKQQVMVSVLRSAAADPAAAAVPSPAASQSVVVAPEDQPAAPARPAVAGSVPTTAPLRDQPAAPTPPVAAAGSVPTAADPAAAVPPPTASQSVVVAPYGQPAAPARPAAVAGNVSSTPLRIQPPAPARPAAAPPAMEQTIVAMSDAVASGAFLAAAIHSAPAGATIHIGAGEFALPEPLEVRQSLRLIGAGMQQTRVIGKQGEAVLKLTGGGPFALHDIAFSYAGTAAADVVVVQAGEIEVLRCRFSGAVHIDSHGGGNGLRLSSIKTAVVSHCEAGANEIGISVYARGASDIIIEQNVCEKNKVGIWYSDSSAAGKNVMICDNTCRENQSTGIIIFRAQLMLQRNTCEKNFDGIRLSDCKGSSARENTCQENRATGITVSDAEPTLEQNTCVLNGASGILYERSAGGTSRGNTCSDNAEHGISVSEGAQPTLEQNLCERNFRAGIFFDFSTGGSASGNTCRENSVGIQINTGVRLTLKNNTCAKNMSKNYVDFNKWWTI